MKEKLVLDSQSCLQSTYRRCRVVLPKVMATIAAIFYLAPLQAAPKPSQPQQVTITYPSSVTRSADGPLQLKAELNYDSSRAAAPIAVVMHGYSGSSGKLAEVRKNAQRLRDAGFFSISVAMRGRDGSSGKRDSGGVEIYDIYDAVEYVKVHYENLVDQTNIHITGYSGGGGNTLSALTRFPDYFRAGSSYFGISDYGFDETDSFYFHGALPNHQQQLRRDVGDPTLGDPDVQDRYQARAARLASRNNPYSEIHLFVDQNEPVCPPFHHQRYRDHALASTSTPSEFENIHVHVGGQGKYYDFNANRTNDADEAQNWPHGYPSVNEQHAAESWYLPRLLAGSILEPTLHQSGTLFVGGFVKTKRFSLWLGDGQNAAGELAYDIRGNQWSFQLKLLSNNKDLKGAIKVDTAPLSGKPLVAALNGRDVARFTGGKLFEQGDFGNGDKITIRTTQQDRTDSVDAPKEIRNESR
ncbi:MAG: prolyl oligopeptidase family serine peptidase [Pirellulales bacterium]|nr:prolyl oligopeptidase family serine peptidase [Pirellulales bacterium]